MKTNSKKLGIFFFILNGFLSVYLTVLAKQAKIMYNISPSTILFIRSVFVFTVFGIILSISKKGGGVISYIKSNIKNYSIIYLILSPGMLAYCWYMAISNVEINVAILITFLQPILISLVSPKILGTKFNKKSFTILLCCFIGVIFYISLSVCSYSKMYLLVGIVVVGRTLYNLFAQKNTDNKLPFIQLIMLSNGFMSILLISQFRNISSIPPESYYIIINILICALIYHLSYFAAVYFTNIVGLQVYEFLRIIYAACLGYIMFNETINLNMFIGITIVLCLNIYNYKFNKKA